MREFTAVINPTAGGARHPGAAARRFLPVARRLRAAGAGLEVAYSGGLAHAELLASEAVRRGRVVLAVGGDGLVGRVAGAVARARGVLGIVPIGRGNDFARYLGQPSGAAELATMLLSGESRRVDLMEAHGTFVAGCLYTGIDALANMHGERARLLGGAAYHYGALRALAGWRPANYRITVDDAVHRVQGYTVVIANTGYYGNGRRAAPQAVADDGALDIVVLHHAPRRIFLKVAMRELYTGAHLERPQVEVLRGHEVRVEADQALPCGGDGEILGSLPMTTRVRPGMLQVVGPKTTGEEGPR